MRRDGPSGRVEEQRPDEQSYQASMRNLSFGFFDDCVPSGGGRILMFYSFETEGHLARSGILHYSVGERRFMGPRHDPELTQAALAFLAASGRIVEPQA